MGRRIFVTGANGFIGGRLVQKLIERGNEVVCLVRDPGNSTAPAWEGVRWVKGDITDKESMRNAMAGSEAVFHLAGRYTIGERDTSAMRAGNVDGARNTLELAAELGVPRILHTSTVGVFGNTHGLIVDESYRAPQAAMVSAYERTKWIAHYEVAEPLQKRGAPVIILQPGFVTGRGDEAPHVSLFEMFLQGSPAMPGARSGLTLAHVDDIAEGHVLAFEKGKPGETYILAGPALTYRELFEFMQRITGVAGPKVWLPGWVAAGSATMMKVVEQTGLRVPFSSEALAVMDDYTYWAKADKAVRELGWRSRPLEETISETVYYLQNRRAESRG